MASQSTTTPLTGGLVYRKTTGSAESYAMLTGSGIQDLALTRAQALALFRVVLADLATDFSQKLEADSELDQISQIHRFHELRARLTSEEPVFGIEEVQEDRRAYDEACEIQATMEQIVGTSWITSLDRICDSLEEAEEALGLDEEDEDEA